MVTDLPDYWLQLFLSVQAAQSGPVGLALSLAQVQINVSNGFQHARTLTRLDASVQSLWSTSGHRSRWRCPTTRRRHRGSFKFKIFFFFVKKAIV